jgi:eukaryotic-like serine/threonine-protein kinase
MALASGDSLGRYTIERPLGSGAMGEVHLARDPRIDRPVALKTLRLAQSVRPGEAAELGERLLREARAAGRLIHPHIVTLFDCGEHAGLLYLAFEYVPGSDLQARLRKGPPLALGEALRIARETAEGLAHAHREGIVHRDVKPSNLLLTADGRVKISDFGIAKLSGESQELTMSGMVMGSPHYLSPEQVRGEALDGRSDLFSLGIVLYEMVAGRRPFAGETLTTLVYQILHQEAPALPPLREGLSPQVPELLAWLLAKDRERRVPDARTAAEAIAALAAALPPALLAQPAVSHDEGTLVLDESAIGSLHTLPPPPGAGAAGMVGKVGGGAGGSGVVPPPPPGAPGPLSATAGGTAPAGGGLVAEGSAVAALAGGAAPAAAPASGRAAAGSPTGGPARPVPAAAAVPSGSYAVPGAGSRRRRGALLAGLAAGVVVVAGLAIAALLVRWPAGEGTASPNDGEVAAVGELAGDPRDSGAPPVDGALGSGSAAAAGAERGAGGRPAEAASAVRGEASPSPAAVPPSPLAEPSVRKPSDGASNPRREQSPPPSRGRDALADSGLPASAAAATDPGPGPTSGATAAPPPAAEETAPDPSPRRLVGRPRSIGPAAAFDETIASGMKLVFRVQPDDAYVLLDGTVVGQAREFSPAARRPLDLPSPGEHTIVLRRAGMRDRTVRVEARPDGPAITPLVGRLLPSAAAETPLHELETHRVGKAIGLRVTPDDARVLVDGRPVGKASQYAGGRMGRGEWLELPLGMHRVSLVAPGHRQIDLAIDVTSGALEERKRIEVSLPKLPPGSER